MSFSLIMTTFGLTLISFSLFWLLSIVKKDAGVVDVYWGPGFAVIALTAFLFSSSTSPYNFIFLLFTIIWAVRLGLHIGLRHAFSNGEDRRYLSMRNKNGPAFWWKSYFKVFILQAVLMWVIATPQLMAFSGDSSIKSYQIILFTLAAFFFLIGLLIETIADWQLYRFKIESKNANKTLSSGLWAYCRHPNYLGEIIVWWGFGLMAFSMNPSFYVFIGPLLLTFLIIHVSGVRLLENHLANDKQGYKDYMKSVNALIPSFKISLSKTSSSS